MNALYFFGWPSDYGGADTKAAHLLELLRDEHRITVVPNWACQLDDAGWTDRLAGMGIGCARFDDLSARLEGIGLALSNERFFADGICRRARARGLRIVWSSEMMWHHAGEREAIEQGQIDRLLYVSPVQKSRLDYESFTKVPTFMTGNFVDPARFSFVDRPERRLTIGRLSRAAPEKYPEDFPVFYEALGLTDVRYRVMAWSDDLAHKYRWHRFGDEWALLHRGAEPAAEFLHSLDLFVYPLGLDFTESWGRSTVEALLTGAVPLVPDGHHFAHLVHHGRTGFLCRDFNDYRAHARRLLAHPDLRRQMSRAAREDAVARLCDRDQHLRLWREALDV